MQHTSVQGTLASNAPGESNPQYRNILIRSPAGIGPGRTASGRQDRRNCDFIGTVQARNRQRCRSPRREHLSGQQIARIGHRIGPTRQKDAPRRSRCVSTIVLQSGLPVSHHATTGNPLPDPGGLRLSCPTDGQTGSEQGQAQSGPRPHRSTARTQVPAPKSSSPLHLSPARGHSNCR